VGMPRLRWLEDVENDSRELKVRDKRKSTVKEWASAALKANVLRRFSLLQDS
jgi:hypothetical protein